MDVDFGDQFTNSHNMGHKYKVSTLKIIFSTSDRCIHHYALTELLCPRTTATVKNAVMSGKQAKWRHVNNSYDIIIVDIGRKLIKFAGKSRIQMLSCYLRAYIFLCCKKIVLIT